MTFCKAANADPIRDFVSWAGTQRAAAQLIGVDESTMSLILAGKRKFQPAHAVSIEAVTGGLFRCNDLMPGIDFVRDDLGAIVGWIVTPESEAA